VSRVRSATEITSVIHGNWKYLFRSMYLSKLIKLFQTTNSLNVGSAAATVDELMGSLMNSSELYQTQRQSDIREEDEREARERVKREQDEAYEQSLQADRAKDEAKRATEQQKHNQEVERQNAADQAQVCYF